MLSFEGKGKAFTCNGVTRRDATALGPKPFKTSAANAALANGTSGHALDWDDTQLATSADRIFGLLTHPTIPPLVAALALGERLRLSGERLLEAFLVGFEVECKIAEAIHPDHYKKGFHTSGTVGTFGAAVAAAKLLELDADQVAHMLAIAASSASGIRVSFGSMTKPLHVGRAAQNGVVAAELAARGFTGGKDALDPPWGFFQTFSHGGAYDHEDDKIYLPLDKVRIIDIGDADIVHTDTAASHANTERAVRKIIERRALPVVLGGDHAVNIPCVRAFRDHGPIHIVQIDAHLDFVDVRHGVREGHGNPMRRAVEQSHVSGLTQIGIRNVSSTARDGYDDARRRGSTILSVRQARKLGAEGVLAAIPAGARYYVTLDIDGFDPSIAPGTGTPSHGGFLYYEVMEILQGLVKRGEVVGIDLVEVAPAYDPSGITGFLAAQVLLNFLGYIFAERELGKG